MEAKPSTSTCSTLPKGWKINYEKFNNGTQLKLETPKNHARSMLKEIYQNQKFTHGRISDAKPYQIQRQKSYHISKS